jgi:hypothetical protein
MAGSKGKPDKLLTGKKLYGTSRNDKRRIRYYAERVEASAILKRQLRQHYCIRSKNYGTKIHIPLLNATKNY